MNAETTWNRNTKTADGLMVMVTRSELEQIELAAYKRGFNDCATGD